MAKPEFESLAEAKEYLRENWQDGVECPCCTQFVKLYPHKLNSTAVSDLIRLYHLSKSGETYYHVSSFSHDRGGAFAKLAHWGLVESELNEDTKKRTSGMWCITSRGRNFVMNKIEIPERAYLFNMKCYGTSKKKVNVRQALGKNFDYEELMSAYNLSY